MEDLRGLELARLFFEEAVAPVVASALPGRPYTAGLIGPCSDVLGLDDAISRDDLSFAETRRQLAFYPDDVRRHVIAAEWQKIAQEQAFPGRAGARGDEVGSAITTARLAESLARLCFYVERAYPPYSKWFGSALRRLGCGDVYDRLAALLTAGEWRQRDERFADALRAVIGVHERAGLLEPGKYQPAPVYLGRPGTGLPAFERGGPPSIETLIDDIRAPITDPAVRALPAALGSINQLSPCCDLTDEVSRRPALATLYRSTRSTA